MIADAGRVSEEDPEAPLWFSHLGCFSDREGYVAITDHDAWATYAKQSAREEFGLRPVPVRENDQTTILETIEWFPTVQSDEDPFHQRARTDRIESDGRSDLLKLWRLEQCRVARSGLRDFAENRWLKFDGTDYSGAAVQALLFAIRPAGTELFTGQEGVWCACVNLYCAGHWPPGTITNRQNRRSLINTLLARRRFKMCGTSQIEATWNLKASKGKSLDLGIAQPS